MTAAIDRVKASKAKCKRNRDQWKKRCASLCAAIRLAEKEHDDLCWGWDGDCGSDDVIRRLVEAMDATMKDTP